MSTVDNGKISYMNGKATAMLFCEPNFEIVGSNLAHCNGTNWDRAIGTCKETDNLPPTTCDFESKDIPSTFPFFYSSNIFCFYLFYSPKRKKKIKITQLKQYADGCTTPTMI